MKRSMVVALVSGLVASGAMALVNAPPSQAGAGDGSLDVRVVRDVNGNGSYDAALEVGVAGIPVTVTDPQGATATGTTTANGTVKVNLAPVSGGKYRVEAAIPDTMSYLKPAPAGGTLSSLTDFADVSGGKNVSLTMGVWNPADYCQDNPDVATACQRSRVVDADANARSVVTFPYNRTGTSPPPAVKATQGQTGTVMGMAYSQQRKLIFSAAYARRLADYGPGGPGGIYATDPATNTTTLWATVPNAGTSAHQVGNNQDGPFFQVTGKESLGAVKLSEDDKTLFVVNLADKKLYTYDATQPTAGAALSSAAIPNPGCPSADDWRPGALAVHDGVVYVGGVCSGESTNKLADVRAVVYRYDQAAGTFSAPIVNKVLDFPRGRVKYQAPDPSFWHPWTDQWNVNLYSIDPPELGSPRQLEYNSPLLTDMVLEANGDLVLGFRDRFSDQTGHGAPAPDGSSPELYTGVSGGDINRVCRQADGAFAWEGTAANCQGNQTAANGGQQDASVVEFYPGEFFYSPKYNDILHKETAQGGLALNYAAPDLLTTDMDPVETVFTGGPKHLNRTDGTATGGYEITSEKTEGFGKAQGLGDLELLCDLAPAQIGNRAWFDANGNGVQDGGEPALAGVKVQLLSCDGSGAALATKTTDAKGEYYFGAADGVKPSTCYTLKFDYSGADTSGLPGAPPASQLSWTAKEAGPSRTVDSNVDPATGTAKVELGGPGSVDNAVDAGVSAGPPNRVGDFVWADTNRNGLQDDGEPGVPGVKVTAQKPDGTPVGTPVTTGPDGKYAISPLPDGPVQVCFDLSGLTGQYAGYTATKPKAGDVGKDSDADPAKGCTDPVTLGADKREDLTLDAGLVPPVNRLGDFVWNDLNKDGLQDAGEPGVSGVPVTLQKDDGTEVSKITTGPDGKYLFEGMPDGSYKVCFGLKSLPAAAADNLPTVANAGDDTKDSDADPATGCTPAVPLGPGTRENFTLDAGLVTPPNKLGDLVWSDNNRNGVQDPDEPGVPGVPVIVKDDKGTQVGQATTGPDGKYLVSPVPDGKFTVCVDLSGLTGQYAGYLPTKPTAGDVTKDSDVDPATKCSAPITLGPDKREDLTVDAGLRPPNRVGDFAWTDSNRNGLQDPDEPGLPGVPVIVKDDKGTQVGQATTGPDGKYLFDKLPDGTFTVCFDLKALPAAVADYQVTKPTAGDVVKDSDADPATGCAKPVTLNADKPEDLTIDAGLAPPVNRLGDFVWNDLNKDGLQDAGEPGVPGVTVTAQKDDGTEVSKTTTGPDGKYLLEGMPDGTYKVCFDVKNLPAAVADYALTKAGSGDAVKDSDADSATGCTAVVTMGAGKRENLTLDVGLVAPPNQIGDLVWSDTNRNGMQDPDEPGVPDVPVVLRDSGGKEVNAKTGPDGKYLFPGLPDGSYTVCFDLKALPSQYAGFMLAKPNAGDVTTDSDADPATACSPAVTVGVGQRENLTVDAGLVEPRNRVGDYVWVDKNPDGLQDPGEPGAVGVPVVLRDGQGAEVAKTTTGPDGKYLFDDVRDGTYVVCFDVGQLPSALAGYKLTTPGAGDDRARDSDADPASGCAKPVTVNAANREVLTVDAGLVAPPKPGAAGKTGKLASTGADVGWLILAGALSLAAGGVLVLFARRRREGDSQ